MHKASVSVVLFFPKKKFLILHRKLHQLEFTFHRGHKVIKANSHGGLGYTVWEVDNSSLSS